jgi:uncharacterized protein YdeI (YjbR/CyaY-like superfamily)
MKPIIRQYVEQARDIEKSGQEITFKKTAQFAMLAEFKAMLDAMRGRQRGYLLFFASAKQAKTRHARVEKYIPAILEGKDLDD